MKRFYFFYLLALVALFTGCQNVFEDSVVAYDEFPSELYVTFADETKVQLNSATQTVWTEDDEISVFYKNDANGRWLFMGKTGARGGAITCQDRGTSTTQIDDVVVVYPYNENYKLNVTNRSIDVNIPSTQTYTEESYGVGNNLMVSVGTTGTISLESVCGWFKIQLTGTGKVKKVTLKANGKEQIAGDATLNYGDKSLKLLSSGSGSDDDFSLGGELIFGEYATAVTLDCGDGVVLKGDEPTSFYLIIAPQTLTEGITIKVECEDGTILEKSTSKAITITRNTIQPMGALSVNGTVDETPDSGEGEGGGNTEGGEGGEGGEGSGDNTEGEGGEGEGDEGNDDPVVPGTAPAANEIWYTSKYSDVVALTASDGFGAVFQSNTYDAELGRGVITFDGDITTVANSAFKSKLNITSVTIPSSVTAIGEYAFSGCTALESVYIPDGVTTIGSNAFSGCSVLANVELPKNLQVINYAAFSGCKALTSVVIPDSVTTIGGSAFSSCSSLTRVTIGKGVTSISHKSGGSDPFGNCASLKAVYISDLSAWCKINFYTNSDNPLNYAKNLYLNDELVTDLVIPADVTAVKSSSFAGCTSIKSVTLHDKVTSIGSSAFYGCSSLEKITIPESLKNIYGYAFYDCGPLSVHISDLEAWCGITYESGNGGDYTNPLRGGGKLYLNDTLVTDLVIPSTVVAIKYRAFAGAVLNSVTIPNRVATIGAYAFHGTTIKSLTIGTGVTEISAFAFASCNKLTKVVIPDNIISIGSNVFGGCTALGKLTIGSGVKTIGDRAFYNCPSLPYITIPDNVTSVGESAFSACTGLTYVEVGKGVTSFGSDAFKNCTGLAAVYITDLAAWCGINFGGMYDYQSNPLYYAKNLYLNDSLVSNLVIPDTVTTLYANAFYNCTSLKSVTIADTVKSIGANCFYGCLSLESVNIGSGVTTIVEKAFYGCSTLPKVVIPTNVKTIGQSAFNNCNSLKEIYLKHTAPYRSSYPVGTGSTFDNIAAEYRFYVPEASRQKYVDTWGATHESRIIGYDYDAEEL